MSFNTLLTVIFFQSLSKGGNAGIHDAIKETWLCSCCCISKKIKKIGTSVWSRLVQPAAQVSVEMAAAHAMSDTTASGQDCGWRRREVSSL